MSFVKGCDHSHMVCPRCEITMQHCVCNPPPWKPHLRVADFLCAECAKEVFDNGEGRE